MGSQLPDVYGRQSEDVRAIFGDLPIVEAKTDFIVYVSADEQQGGVRGDPRNCMFANACKRALGSHGVLFYPTVAYVDVVEPMNPSNRIVMRFTLPPATRDALEAFDRGEGGFREASFILKAVTKGRTLAAQAKAKRKAHRAQRGEVSEVRKAAARKGHETRRAKALMGIRNGSGQVHTRSAEA